MESGKRGWLFLTTWRDSQTPKIKHLHRNGMWLLMSQVFMASSGMALLEHLFEILDHGVPTH